MPYTDRRIGWHLDLAHRDALIEAYKKRCPAPVILLVSVNLSNSSGIQERKSCVTMRETGNTQIKHWRWNWCGDCLHVLMRVWMIRSLNRTLMSIECLHHCQINALCSWTALQTVGRCRSSQKHSWSDYDAWKVKFCAAVSISGEKKITIKSASVSCKWSSLCYLRLQKPCAHPAHLRIKKPLISLNWLTWWLPKGLLQGLSTGHY